MVAVYEHEIRSDSRYYLLDCIDPRSYCLYFLSNCFLKRVKPLLNRSKLLFEVF